MGQKILDVWHVIPAQEFLKMSDELLYAKFLDLCINVKCREVKLKEGATKRQSDKVKEAKESEAIINRASRRYQTIS